MDSLDIIVENKHYKFLKCMNINNKNYIAYTDSDNIYFSEYVFENNELILLPTNNEIIKLIREEMKL